MLGARKEKRSRFLSAVPIVELATRNCATLRNCSRSVLVNCKSLVGTCPQLRDLADLLLLSMRLLKMRQGNDRARRQSWNWLLGHLAFTQPCAYAFAKHAHRLKRALKGFELFKNYQSGSSRRKSLCRRMSRPSARPQFAKKRPGQYQNPWVSESSDSLRGQRVGQNRG